jgi:hypothetical protein
MVSPEAYANIESNALRMFAYYQKHEAEMTPEQKQKWLNLLGALAIYLGAPMPDEECPI